MGFSQRGSDKRGNKLVNRSGRRFLEDDDDHDCSRDSDDSSSSEEDEDFSNGYKDNEYTSEKNKCSKPRHWWRMMLGPRRKVVLLLFFLAIAICSIAWVLDVLESPEAHGRVAVRPEPVQIPKKKKSVDPKALQQITPQQLAHDAFGIVEAYLPPDKPFQANRVFSQQQIEEFLQQAYELRKKFEARYAPYARPLLAKSLLPIELDEQRPQETAPHAQLAKFWLSTLKQHRRRIRSRATMASSQFVVVILGNSAAAGYGNYHDQAYSYVWQRLLEPVVQTLLGQQLRIINLAMDDLTEFPTTWCFPKYVPPVDMIVWDFVGSPPSRLEAFVRTLALQQQLKQLGSHRPFLVARHTETEMETASVYIRVLRKYCESTRFFHGCLWLDDTNPLVVDNLVQLEGPPPGFQEWDELGANQAIPHHHSPFLSLKQHEYIAWLMTMHMLSALELVVAGAVVPEQIKEVYGGLLRLEEDFTSTAGVLLPSPLLLESSLDPIFSWSAEKQTYLDCFTTYEWVARSEGMEEMPVDGVVRHVKEKDRFALAHAKTSVLPDLLVKGHIGEGSELLLPKSAQWHQLAWVLDLAAATKKFKQRTRRHFHKSEDPKIQEAAFFGFVDWKQAYYGVYQSGVLHFFVPIPEYDKGWISFGSSSELPRATEYVESLIICQADDVTTNQYVGCSLRNDVKIRIGGKETESSEALEPDVVTTLAENGPALCRRVRIPEESQLSRVEDTKGNKASKARLQEVGSAFGLNVEMEVSDPRVIWKQGPCSIAHLLVEKKLKVSTTTDR